MRQPQIKQVTWPALVHHMEPSQSGVHMPCCGHGCQCKAHTWATTVTFEPDGGVRALRRALHATTAIPEHLQCISIECINRSFFLNKSASFDLQRLCETNQQHAGAGVYIMCHSLPEPSSETGFRRVREEEGARRGVREESIEATPMSLDVL